MTDRQRKALDWLLIAALTALLGAGSGYVGDSIRDAEQDASLQRIQSDVSEIKQRVTEMYCGTVPQERRAGCR